MYFCLQRIERLDAVERLLPIARHAADAIVRLAVAVERDVQIEIELRIVSEGAIHDVVNTRFNESIGGNDDAIDAVVCNKEIDDVGEIASQRRLAAGKPEIRDRRHRPRDFLDLRESQVARLVQLFVIEARLAERVATGSDEQDHRAESLFAFRRSQQLHKLYGFVGH